MSHSQLKELQQLLGPHPKLFVVTGAGLSTPSQIPDYRDNQGNWKRKPPVMYQDFLSREAVRKRYWGRSLVGWQFFSRAKPNAAHRALVELEKMASIELVVTQNVDNLHQQAGQQRLLPLHGTLDLVKCMSCGDAECRKEFQHRLITMNPLYAELSADAAPDGDAELEDIAFDTFNVPDCRTCGGILKPNAVFYGESVPTERHTLASKKLQAADLLLLVGTSLMVYSGYRLAKQAHEQGTPIVAINLGATRADPLLRLKVAAPVQEALPELVNALKTARAE